MESSTGGDDGTWAGRRIRRVRKRTHAVGHSGPLSGAGGNKGISSRGKRRGRGLSRDANGSACLT